ncbi:hypothetical protein [Rufibacter quisquiliarum]|uniref:Uncharacterized protein n=1 Tax=Rufibacter quisquiliarum TaxID=1549639 RepID=A0A839GGK8_9BACT|nr:hypothetical protein [Rufibacter quisquiliarum]MBA9078784.1 hypothetical protein [Rufibacter quisquiliarum]
MKTNEHVGLFATFTDLYPNEDITKINIEDLIKDIPLDAIMRVMSYINLGTFFTQSSESFQEHVLRIITSNFPNKLKSKINYSQFYSKFSDNKFLYIVNTQSNIKIIEKALQVCKEGDANTISPEQELRLFEAILLANEQIQQDQIKSFNSNKEIETLEDIYFKRFLPIIVSSGDFLNLDIKSEILSQVCKGVFLLRFLDNHPKLSQILHEFLTEKGFTKWEEYLQTIFSLVFVFKPLSENFEYVQVLDFPEQEQIAFDLANKLAININIDLKTLAQNSIDHLELRKFPLYKVNNNSFYPLSINFLYNKFYDGLFWELNSVAKQFDKKLNFLSIIRKDFTEEYLLYSQLENIYNKCMTFSGLQQSNFYKSTIGKDIEKTDYYVRHTKNIYLFECKDNSLSSDAKVSQDVDKIFDFLDRPKAGVRQLATSIKELNIKPFDFDDYESKGIKSRNIVIQPILIVTDRSLKQNGINTILAKELNSQLKDVEVWNIKCKELVVINIETLILHNDYLSLDKRNLKNLIKEYHQSLKELERKLIVRNMDDLISKYPSFDYFVFRKNRNFEIPKSINKELKHILG